MFTKEQIEEIRARLALTGYKDTQFKQATLPLNGDELVAIVQKGENKKVPARVFLHKEEQETGSIKHVVLSQAEYDALPVKDITTIYLIVNIPNISDNWVFGNTFPITFAKAWSFGGKFPILLK